jgi:ABC-2 type transporter
VAISCSIVLDLCSSSLSCKTSGAMQGASALLQDRIIFYKHSAANFYSAWPFVFGRVLSQLPQVNIIVLFAILDWTSFLISCDCFVVKTIADTVTFATIMYYQIGLAGRVEPINFFTYLAILVTFAILMNTQLSLFASFASGAQVQVYSSVTLLAMMLFGGFIIPPDAIPAYYLWIYWWNPFAWAYRALVVNEFYSDRWDDPTQILDDNGFVDPTGTVYGSDWVGLSFLFMVPYLLFCCFLSAVGLTYVRSNARNTTEIAPNQSKVEKNNQSPERVEIPFKPVTLSFHDICYEVTASTTNEQLLLLKKVNGIFRPGQMCALMVR